MEAVGAEAVGTEAAGIWGAKWKIAETAAHKSKSVSTFTNRKSKEEETVRRDMLL